MKYNFFLELIRSLLKHKIFIIELKRKYNVIKHTWRDTVIYIMNITFQYFCMKHQINIDIVGYNPM